MLALQRSGAIIAVTLIGLVVFYLARLLRIQAAERIPQRWHEFCRWVLGMEVRIHGAEASPGPALLVCNHVSYLDVTAIASAIDVNFIAKAEVADWPILGFLARLPKTLFIDRRPRSAPDQRDAIQKRLAEGARLVLFPEGTSSNGNYVLPFKSTLFSVAETVDSERPVRVQPVTICYSRFDGFPMGRALRPCFAWYGDMTLVDHLWRCIGMGRVGIDLVFHEPVTPAQFPSRKALAHYCHSQISKGLSDALAGRLGLPWQPAPSPFRRPGSLRRRAVSAARSACPVPLEQSGERLETARDI